MTALTSPTCSFILACARDVHLRRPPRSAPPRPTAGPARSKSGSSVTIEFAIQRRDNADINFDAIFNRVCRPRLVLELARNMDQGYRWKEGVMGHAQGFKFDPLNAASASKQRDRGNVGMSQKLVDKNLASNSNAWLDTPTHDA
ncbi:hypothetical protein EVAR_44706_1 [Eumeta japonica]|uniref:Uncharacterized protein n=1 Tax=Eumeta variegata TaxID=151549 RepID=A0A4C1XFY1_EUMVA|nr:hypothetical protein EVAR_44706_1 [Eumeta japonica]